MKKKSMRFMKRIASVFLSLVLAVGMLTEMDLIDVGAADVGTITATVTFFIEGWDGVAEPEKTNIEVHLFFCPDAGALNNLGDGRSVEVTEYANVAKSIKGNKLIYTYTWPSNTPYLGSNTVLGISVSSKLDSAGGQMGLDDIAAYPQRDYLASFNVQTYLYRFMDGDKMLEAYHYSDRGSTQYIEFPEDPEKANHIFKGWVKKDGTPARADDPSLYYTSNSYPMDLYATWESTGHSHNWDTDWKNNEDTHWHDCTAADCPVTDVSQKDGYGTHSWDAGTVTKEPTESETGIKKYQCTVCGYEKTESIPVKVPGHIHDYGTEWKKDDLGHWHECSCKDKADEAPHREGSGIITKEPTETETGIISYPCVDCGHVIRTETIPAKEGGDVSGNDPGNTPGDNDENNPGNTPGDNDENDSGNIPGDNGENDSGNTPGDNGGNIPGNNSGTDSGNAPGNDNTENGNGGSSAPGHTDSVVSTVGGDRVKGGQKGKEPKTGDFPRIEIYATIAMISGMLYLYLGDADRGMTEEEKKELVSCLIGWAKKGGNFRRAAALAAIFFLLFYYHSIGKRRNVNIKELCG